MDDKQLQKLIAATKQNRIDAIKCIGHLGVGHIGGVMSIIELLTVLYERHMNVDCTNPAKKDRDKLVLSKGHAGPALYSVLANKGFFPKQWLFSLNQGGTRLPSHCDMNKTPGIDMTTGSLGQGISAAIGLAIANKLDNLDSKIYLIIGDGESNEGQIWEGAMAAVHYKLDNLIGFTDYNKMQIDGYIKDVMDLSDLEAKWRAFGWSVERVDGHSLLDLDAVITHTKIRQTKPTMIIMDTIKGKGCFFAEGRLECHNMAFNYEQALEAIERLQLED